jgi:Cft2 family RNA processing exonuclease
VRHVAWRDREDPLGRVLIETANALKARQRLHVRDPRRVGSTWLRPNWPDGLLLGIHRNRLVEALAQDGALRKEVRERLKLPTVSVSSGAPPRGQEQHSPSAEDAAGLLAAEVATAGNPLELLEAAAVDPDPAFAAAASPYLSGELPIPIVVPRAARPAADARPALPDPELRSQLREAKARVKSLHRDLREQQNETLRLRGEVSSAIQKAERAEEAARTLRGELPSRHEREALASAATQQDKISELRRKLDAQRGAARAESRELRERVSEAEQALARAQDRLDAEQRGRRRLEADLGDAAGRAGRLVPLAEREATALLQEASGMHDGPAKTRKMRRADNLHQLVASLRELYALGPADGSGGVDSAAADGRPARRAAATVVRSRGLAVSPLGGANHIGGSALLVEAGGTRLLVDAGLKPQAHISHPGPDHIDEAMRERIDAIIVTHAHADHAGYVPWVVERQRRADVFCSPETKALLPTVWADSVRVMRADADAASSHEHCEPPYGEAEVVQAEDALRSTGYGQTVTIGDVEVTLFRAGHILGAAGVVIRAGERRVVVTGDIDDRGQASVGPAQIPQHLAGEADLLAIETTYCDSVHRDRGHEGEGLVRQAEEVLGAGGRILIPAFGLGRAQEIALLLGDRLPDADVLVDGLARDISDLYARNGAPEVIRGRVRKVVHREREIIGFHEGVIVTTSGMLTGGAAIPWAKAVLLEPDSALFLCGHQDEEAPGHELERLADADPERPRSVQLRDDQGKPVTIQVVSAVYKYNLSAHADRSGLRRIVDQVHPRAIMLVHGEPGPQALFRARLNVGGYTVVDNRKPWDADAVVPDERLARRRHGARTRRHGSRYRRSGL